MAPAHADLYSVRQISVFQTFNAGQDSMPMDIKLYSALCKINDNRYQLSRSTDIDPATASGLPEKYDGGGGEGSPKVELNPKLKKYRF